MAFLSDRLEEIHNSDLSIQEKFKEIIKELQSRFPNPSKNEDGVRKFLDTLKSIDNTYRYFCKQHKEYNPDFFRNFVCGDRDDDDEETRELHRKFRRALNW